jgi:hypothetical protein
MVNSFRNNVFGDTAGNKMKKMRKKYLKMKKTE